MTRHEVARGLFGVAILSCLVIYASNNNESNELLKVRAELVRTKELLLSCQVMNANSNLTIEKQKIIQEFKCKNDFDWDKLACKEVNDK